MDTGVPETNDAQVTLQPVDQSNWRAVTRLEVFDDQREFVAEPCSYLALCCYGQDWQPLAICRGGQVIGFMMWSTDPADGSCWLGGIFIDRDSQRQGYGRQAVRAAMAMLKERHGYEDFALSYQPANLAARSLYLQLGFVETGELEGTEVVARLSLGY
jgi:diamine N-acetyltransferase